VAAPDWIWFVFIFAFGCCVGSFLNVVIYRLPRDRSIITPASACPACGRHIRFYDNIPLISWLLLGRKCRYCKASISPRYFVIELLTGLVFIGLFILYFRTDLRAGVGPFLGDGWFIYLTSIILLSAFISASAIDLELWVIPLSICWFVTAAGLLGSMLGVYILEPVVIRGYGLLPSASAGTGSLAAGAAIGLAISLVLLGTGLIKRSYESEPSADDESQIEQGPERERGVEKTDEPRVTPQDTLRWSDESQINHRLEVCREIIFLLPIIICSLTAYLISQRNPRIHDWWVGFSQVPVVAGLLGSLLGYFVGCGVVWATRILGTLGFGKEAMGLGDVHLMGAAGTVIGPVLVVVAFFIAPFFGLGWAAFQMLFKKTRRIPYGPFLSLAVFAVMILHDRIFSYLSFIFYR